MRKSLLISVLAACPIAFGQSQPDVLSASAAKEASPAEAPIQFLPRNSADIQAVIAQENKRRKALEAAIRDELKATESEAVVRSQAAQVQSVGNAKEAAAAAAEWVVTWREWHATHAREAAREIAAMQLERAAEAPRDISEIVAMQKEKLRFAEPLARALETASQADALALEVDFTTRLNRLQSSARENQKPNQ